MKSFLISILIGISLLISSCENSPTSPGIDGDLIPLKLGNYWGYTYFRYDSTGVTTDTLKWVELVDSDTLINGQRYYSIRDFVTMFFGFKIFYINKADGIYRFSNYLESLSRQFKYPVKQNEVIYRETDTLQVISLIQKVVTPAGEFYCIVYQSMKQVGVTWYYYENTYIAPGIGKVKIETGYSKDKVHLVNNSMLQLEIYKNN